MLRSAVVTSCLLSVVSACSEPLEFADWTIPVPEGTRIIEYSAVPNRERTDRIELAEDLVLGAGNADRNRAFYRPSDVAVDSSGRIFVVDSGNQRIQVFDDDGVFLRTLGREGDGPGEFRSPRSIAFFGGDRVAVVDHRRGQIVVWTTVGEHVADYPVTGVGDLAVIRGSPQTLVASVQPDRGNLYGGDWTWAGGTLSLETGAVAAFAELPYTTLPAVERRGSDGRPAFWYVDFPVPRPLLSVSRSGELYVAPGDEYQLTSLGSNLAMDWALRVAMQPPRLSDWMVDAEATRLREHFPDLLASELPRPNRLAAVTALAIDGHGHVYVYPNVGDNTSEEFAVDVYSSEGERLFAGVISAAGWLAAHNDHVLRIESTVDGRRIVRYRLVEPF